MSSDAPAARVRVEGGRTYYTQQTKGRPVRERLAPAGRAARRAGSGAKSVGGFGARVASKAGGAANRRIKEKLEGPSLGELQVRAEKARLQRQITGPRPRARALSIRVSGTSSQDPEVKDLSKRLQVLRLQRALAKENALAERDRERRLRA